MQLRTVRCIECACRKKCSTTRICNKDNLIIIIVRICTIICPDIKKGATVPLFYVLSLIDYLFRRFSSSSSISFNFFSFNG